MFVDCFLVLGVYFGLLGFVGVWWFEFLSSRVFICYYDVVDWLIVFGLVLSCLCV